MPPRMPNTLWMNSGGLTMPRVEEVMRRVQVPDVVALDLEARAVVGARGQDVLDVLERVAEDAVVGRPQVVALPVEAELA